MRKAILVMVLVVIVLSGCERYKAAVEKVEKEDLKGQWKVVNINCPEVLAEKDGEKRIFQYESPYGRYNASLLTKIKLCQKTVKPGWIIFVNSTRNYSFFPPPVK